MANFDDNPFAGDSENPFAVSICSVNRFLLRLMAPVCCNRAQYSEKQVIVLKIMLEMSCSFQDPSVASVTSNAARGLEDFNPFADQNTSQASGAKVVHFRTFLYLKISLLFRLSVCGLVYPFRFVEMHSYREPMVTAISF